MPHKKKKIPTFFSIILYLLYLFICIEAVARIALANEKFYNKIKGGQYMSDSIWRLDWIKRHKKEKEIKIDFKYDLHHPLLGWVPKPNIKNMPVFNNKFLNINSKGIRGTQEFEYSRNNKKRILILGESFTFGTEVSDNETYSHYLQELLPNTEILNMGVHGYGYDQMLLYLKEEGIKYKPDIILIPFLEIDKKRSLMSFRDYAKPTFKIKNDKLVLINKQISHPKRFFLNEKFRLKTVDLIKILKRNLEVKNGTYKKNEDKITRLLLSEIVKTSRDNGAIPMFIYLEGMRDTIKKQEPDEEDKAFMTYWNNQKVPSIYPLPYLLVANSALVYSMQKAGKPVPKYFKRQYGHYSPRENSVIAIAIREFLTKYNFVK